MAKEILMYGDVDERLAIQVITDLNNSLEEDIKVRVNTPGGSTIYNNGMIAKFAEHPKAKTVIVDGAAFSAGLYFCVNAEYVECHDVSEFLLHRAAYPAWIERNPEYFDDSMRAQLNRINAKFNKSVSNKLDIEALQEIMDSKPELNGAKYKDIFSLDTRLDVFLNAKEAKKIGLVNKIIDITPAKREEIKANMNLIAAKYIETPKAEKPKIETPKTNKIMDLNTLKNTHPALYNEVVALGKTEGAAEENDRISAWMEFIDIDAKAVTEGIASGKAPSFKNIAEFSRKAMGKEFVAGANAEKVPPVKTPIAAAVVAGAELTEEQKKKAAELEAFNKEVEAKIKEKIGTV